MGYEIDGKAFTTFAQKSACMPGSSGAQSQSPQGSGMSWSRPEYGWKWREKAGGEDAASDFSDANDANGKMLHDSRASNQDDSEQKRPALVEKESRETSGNHNPSPQNEKPFDANNADPEKSKDRRSSLSDWPTSIRPKGEYKYSKVKKVPRHGPLTATRRAIDRDAEVYNIHRGSSLRHWDPIEEPILLLGSVFDANSLGKWIFDWTVYIRGHSTPISEVAVELWLLLIQLAGKIKHGKETVSLIRIAEDRDMVEDFVVSGERLIEMLEKLLKICEKPMLWGARDESTPLGNRSGTEFARRCLGESGSYGERRRSCSPFAYGLCGSTQIVTKSSKISSKIQ